MQMQLRAKRKVKAYSKCSVKLMSASNGLDTGESEVKMASRVWC